MDTESSLALIERAKAGDGSALDELLARYRPRLQRWARGRLPSYARDLADTEDVVQDVLVRTLKSFPSFECRGEWALQAYLRRAVANRIRDELRRVHGRPEIEDVSETIPSGDLSPIEVAVGRETFARYDAALATLSEIDRECVIARLELGCSYQEVASLIESPSADAARMTVVRALAKIAHLMSAR